MFYLNINLSKKESTNLCIETFYEHLLEYKTLCQEHRNDNNQIELLDPKKINIEDYEGIYNLYQLNIEDDTMYCCQSIIPLIQYLAELEWNNIDWTIIKITSDV